MKTNYGSVTNPATGVVKDIIVSAKCGNKLKDILIGGAAVLARMDRKHTTRLRIKHLMTRGCW